MCTHTLSLKHTHKHTHNTRMYTQNHAHAALPCIHTQAYALLTCVHTQASLLACAFLVHTLRSLMHLRYASVCPFKLALYLSLSLSLFLSLSLSHTLSRTRPTNPHGRHESSSPSFRRKPTSTKSLRHTAPPSISLSPPPHCRSPPVTNPESMGRLERHHKKPVCALSLQARASSTQRRSLGRSRSRRNAATKSNGKRRYNHHDRRHSNPK
jgi:hypothetical protein